MITIVKAELVRLLRRRTVLTAGLGALLFAVVATLTVIPSAEAGAELSRRGGTSLEALTGTGGGTEAFAVGASFVGFLPFVVFIALVAGEFSGGTFRALVLREPQRLRILTGKLVAPLLVAAGVVAAAELATFALSFAVAPGQDIPTDGWLSLSSLAEGVQDYANVLAGIAAWAVFGTVLAVVFRSTPVALGVGFVWAGPFENIVVQSWDTGFRVFPGQVFGSLIRGGTAELGMGQAVATTAVYAGLAAVASFLLVARRDVTA